MVLSAGARLGSYEILGSLGAGGMGEVYRARDTRLDRDVALKILPSAFTGDPERLARFMREARALASLNHPHIVTIHSTEEADAIRFLTMELIEGLTLETLIPRSGLPLERFFDIALPLADAVAAAHARQVTHRDLKPANVMVSDDGRVKVLDFGLARFDRDDAAEAETALGLTGAGKVVGTMPYMSPEQIEGRPLDARTDVFSLGVILYEMLSGTRPFDGGSGPALMSAILRDQPERLDRVRPDVSAALGVLIDRCLAKAVEARVQSARELHDELKAVATFRLKPEATDDRRSSFRLQPEVDHRLQPDVHTRHGIVVLPFANVGGDLEDDYFSDGLTEEVIADLSRVKALQVISRSSSLRLKGTTLDIRSIASELGVSHVLEGSVRKAGRQLRITVQLVDAASDTQIWSDKYSGTVDDVFDVQERVSREIVRALDVKLTSDEDHRLAARPIQDPRIFEITLRARHEIRRASLEATSRALAILAEGEAIDPGNVALEALRVHAEGFRFKAGAPMDPVEFGRLEQRARDVYARAPDSMLGNFVVGYLAFQRGDQELAARHLKRAVEIQPEPEALTFLALTYIYVGHLDASMAVTRRLLALDPLTPTAWVCAAVVDWFNGRYDEGIASLDRAIELEPNSPLMRWHRSYVMLLAGRHEAAIPDAEWMNKVAPDMPYTRQLLAMLAALRGDRDEARRLLAPLERLDLDHHLSFHIGEAEALVGNIDRAIAQIDRAVRHGFYPHKFIAEFDPFIDVLRPDPRFQAIIEEAQRKSKGFQE